MTRRVVEKLCAKKVCVDFFCPYPEGSARHLDVPGQKLSPHCLEPIFDSQLPSPKSSPKMPPKLSLPHRRGHFFLFQNYPCGEGNCEAIERHLDVPGQFLSRDIKMSRRAHWSGTENQPKEEVFGKDIPRTSGGHSRGYPDPKLRSGCSKSWKNRHLGADIHDPKVRTSTTLRDFQELRSEKLWAEFSFSNWVMKRSESDSGVSPELFRNLFRKVPAVP